MIEKKHENCERCDWLGHEAQSTAEEMGRDTWLALDDPTDHFALYTADTEEAPDA